MSAELAVYTLLKDTAATSSIVSTRIYPFTAPQGITRPFITYQRISGVRWRSVDGPSGMAVPRVQVDAYSPTYAGVKALATAIRQTLDGYRGTVGGVRVGDIALETDRDFYEDAVDPPLHRVSMDFMVTHDE